MSRPFDLSCDGAGQRVEAHPGCDCWMMGDRFGRVTKVGRKLVHVRMDVSGKTRRFPPDLLIVRPGQRVVEAFL